MKSHFYELTAKDVLAIVGSPLLVLSAFACAMHIGATVNLLPPPRATLDTDRTILFHQADASRRTQDASVLLIGDSSCLMDVSALQLSETLPAGESALNLGTLSYLDLRAFAGMLRHYAAANPARLRAVVLLMHPEALRRPAPAEDYVAALAHFYEGTDHCGANVPPLLCALGVEKFKSRVLSQMMPKPLPGIYGHRYGFTHDLWNYLSVHRGSLLDPGRFNPSSPGNVEYRLAKSLETASQEFRAVVPPGVKLVVGITPVPESVVGPGYGELHGEMLRTWSGWLRADAALEELPVTLADDLFASTTHLNESGVRHYTERIGQALLRLLPKPQPGALP
jgi:hypothetical protein